MTDASAFSIGTALVELGRREDAVAWLHRCLLANPESSAAALALAHSLVDLGLIPEALSAAGAVWDLGEDHPVNLLLRAKICVVREQGADALALLAKIPPDQRPPESGALHRHALLQSGAFEAAAAAFAAALELEPAEPLLWIGLGYARLWLEDLPSARAAAERAEALDPSIAALPALRHYLGGAVSPVARTLPSWASLTRTAAARNSIRAGLKDRQAAARAARTALRARAQPLRYVVAPALSVRSTEPTIVVTGSSAAARSHLARILTHCGVPIQADGVRRPDACSPDGYLEWEPVKDLANHPRILEQAAGRIVIVPAELLGQASPQSRLLVLLLGGAGGMVSPAFSRCPCLPIDPQRLLTQPAEVIAEIAQFVGPGKVTRPDGYRGVLQS